MNITQILKRADENRYKKAYDYVRKNRIKNPIIYDDQLIAEVIGSDIYRVKININKKEFNCTCPDNTQYCKHILAVLIMYDKNKRKFFNFDNVLTDLNKKDTSELILIIKQMYLNKIDLINLLNLKNVKINEINSFSEDLYGVEDFFGDYVGYDEVPGLLKRLYSLYDLGLENKERRDFTTAFAILWSIVRTLCYKIGECDDSNGQIAEFFYNCVIHLAEIMNQVIRDQKSREKYYEEVFKVWSETDFGIDDGLLNLIEDSFEKKDVNFLIDKINSLLNKKMSPYFEEYRKPELKELKNYLTKVKNGNTKTNKEN